MSRFLFVSAASAMLSLGGLFAQAAPQPSSKPASDMARFERVAAELRRAGDEKLAEEVMEAARKIAADKATDKAADKPVASARAGRRQPPGEGVPAVADVPTLGRLFAVQDVPAPTPAEVPSLEPLTGLLSVGRESASLGRRRVVAQSVVPPVAEAPTPPPPPASTADAVRSLMFARPTPAPSATPEPSAAPSHEYTHRHEVHHYFHGAPPSGTGLGFGGTIAPPTPPPPGQAPATRGAFRALAPMDPFSARSPRDPRTPATAPTPAFPATPATPAHPPFGAQAARRRLIDLATPAPVRATRPRSPNPVRAGGATAPATGPAYTTPPDAPPARRVRVASPEDRMENEVDGLRREVEELRELLQKLRTQVKQRKPD